MSFTMWFRGRLVQVVGEIEPPDRGVGIMTESFLVSAIIPLPPFPRLVFENSYGDDEDWPNLFGDLFSTISAGEWQAISEAFFDSRPLDDDDLMVYWGTEEEMDPERFIATLDNGRAWPQAENE